MKAFFRNIDPDSFRGKVWLLAIDKVVIGAFIGLAVFGYYLFTSRDIRTYETNRDEIQLSFKRAEYVRQLVPIVLDDHKDALFRAHLLGALIETQSIEASSAVYFANRLLLSDDDAILIREGDFLKFRLLLAMPTGLPEVLNQYRSNLNTYNNDPDNKLRSDHRSRIQYFWSTVVQETVRRNMDMGIDVLNSDAFLENNLRTLVDMLPSLNATEAQKWAASDVKGIQIFGNLEILRPILNRPPGTTNFPTRPITILSSIVDPLTNPEQMGLATEMIVVLIERSIASREISLDLLTALAKREVRPAVQNHSPLEGFDERVHRMANWSYRALDYLKWSAKSSRDVAEAIEAPALEAVGDFYQRLKAEHADAFDQQTNLIDRGLIDVLMNTTLASNRPTTERSRELLTELFSLDDESLRKAGMWAEAQDWKSGEWKRKAEYE